MAYRVQKLSNLPNIQQVVTAKAERGNSNINPQLDWALVHHFRTTPATI